MGSNSVSHVIAYSRINIKRVSFPVSVVENKSIITWKQVSQIMKDSYFANYVSNSRKSKKFTLKKVGRSIKAEKYKSKNIKKNNFKSLSKSQIKKYHRFIKK